MILKYFIGEKMCPNIEGKCLLCLTRGVDGIDLTSEFSTS